MALSPLTQAATAALRPLASQPPDAQTLNAALWVLAKWRAELVANTLAQRSGYTVLSGPFRGMTYDQSASEGSRSARLLGCHEASLAPIIEEIVARAYPLVIDIGTAEGYYRVGLARRMPATRVLARDASAKAMALCRTQTLANRFAASHHVRRIDRALDPAALPPWMEELSDPDRLIALWEWRAGPTPWLWMTAK